METRLSHTHYLCLYDGEQKKHMYPPQFWLSKTDLLHLLTWNFFSLAGQLQNAAVRLTNWQISLLDLKFIIAIWKYRIISLFQCTFYACFYF